MNTSDFYYDLPAELIAQTPIEPRNASRLMVLDRLSGKIEHKIFSQLDSTILMPGHGPPTTLGAAKAIYNQNLPQKKLN